MAKIYITDTILRDAHQSQAATRMRLSDMLPACELLDSIGYWSLECWGGATFDACMRFLNEDPWERLRQLRKHMPNTKLQMLLRGQNLLGYKHYADDVVEAFCAKSIENGIDVGADSICIKDMANLLLPFDAYNLVKKLKQSVKVPIHLHTHNTTGTGDMVYLMAAQAGVDIIDTALSPMANGTSQPATESMVATFKGTEFDTGLDMDKLLQGATHFRKVADRLKAEGSLDPKVLNTDVKTLVYQVPGGMLSNLISQLKQANAEDKYYDVLAEVPRVRKDFGYPPLVTPTSQIVGSQAVLNVLSGERYKMVSKESKALLRGEYGRLPGQVNEEVRRKAIGSDTVITCRPADLIKPEMPKYREETKGVATCEEDVLSYALFPQVASAFFAKRAEKAAEADPNAVRELYVEDMGN